MLNLYNQFNNPQILNNYATDYPFVNAICDLIGYDNNVDVYSDFDVQFDKNALKILTQYKTRSSKHPRYAYLYAYYIMGSRWKEVEHVIMKDYGASIDYAHNVIKGRWKEAEDVIINDGLAACSYAVQIMKERWPGAESIIISEGNTDSAYLYAVFAINKDKPNPPIRWPEGEPIIMEDPYNAYRYATHVLKERWIEAEPIIMEDEYWWGEYQRNFKML